MQLLLDYVTVDDACLKRDKERKRERKKEKRKKESKKERERERAIAVLPTIFVVRRITK